MDSEERLEPGLYLVATPLGTLGDLSPRAREVFSRALFWAAESSSSAGRWMQILDPPVRPRVLSYRDGSRDKDAAAILAKLREGASVVLFSDAGTPTISDPGWHLVDMVRDAELPVWAIPGPCAAITALTLAGFPARRFFFEGFLPASGRLRREALERIQSELAPVVLYESPHRLSETLEDLAKFPEERGLYVGRELTKKFEESWRGGIHEAAGVWREKRIQGEFTLVLGPRNLPEEEPSDLPQESLEFVRSLGLPTKTASAILKHFFPGASKKELYSLLSQSNP